MRSKGLGREDSEVVKKLALIELGLYPSNHQSLAALIKSSVVRDLKSPFQGDIMDTEDFNYSRAISKIFHEHHYMDYFWKWIVLCLCNECSQPLDIVRQLILAMTGRL